MTSNQQPQHEFASALAADPALAKHSIQVWLGIIALLLLVSQIIWWITGEQDTELNRGVDTSHVQIDINVAREREFSLLPSVGPVLAKRIVANRNQHGPFADLHDLMRVHGIGEKKFAQISVYCTVDFTADFTADNKADFTVDNTVDPRDPPNAVVALTESTAAEPK